MRQAVTLVLSLIIFVGVFFFFTKIQSDRRLEGEEKDHGTSDAMQALLFWSNSRAYPNKDIPADKYYRAFQNAKLKHREITSTLTAGSTWDPIGPLNLQGRALSVALNPMNPNTVYVGTASGGLWRSYTGGLTGDWQRVKLGYPALGISAIVIDPTDTNVIYTGTGEVYQYQRANGGVAIRTMRGSYGIGILKTIDGGLTWSKSLDWSYSGQTGIQALRMNPINHGTIWAATTEGIYRSVDAGGSWGSVYPANMAEDIVINPLDTSKILASIGDMSTSVILLTTDGGSIWNTSPFETMHTYSGKTLLEMYGANPNIVFASAADSTIDNGALYRTSDFGVSWTKLYTPINLYQVQGWYSHFVAVHPADSSQIVYASVNTIKSIDGGSTFQAHGAGYGGGNYGDNHGFAHHPTNPNILYIVNDDGVYRSSDFGSTFTSVGYGMQTGQFYNGFSGSMTDSLLAIGQCQDHIPGYRYLGSNAWDHGSVTDEVGWTAIDQSNDNIMYADNRNGQYIYKSIDRGATFSWIGSFEYLGSGGWNSPFVLSPANTSVLYLGDIHIHKSINGGSSWSTTNGGSPLDGNTALSMAISPTSPDTVYVGMAPVATRAHVFRTTNGGTAWQDITGTLPDRYPMDLAVNPQNSKTVYAAFGGFGTGHLYKSIDAGTTWSDVTGSLPDVPTTAVVVDPLDSNLVYAGNDLGVYVSTNGGSSWAGFNDGLPDAVIVADLSISPSNRTLRVVTHGNGVWERKLLPGLPSGYFDYKASAFTFPIDGFHYQIGTTIPALRASFQNLSAQAQTDSFNVRFQILHGNSLLYADTRRIKALSFGENRLVTFNGVFSPPDTGYYTLEAITLTSDMNAHDDTLRGAILVVVPSTISGAEVSKIYSPYTEILGGSPGPSGDDVQSSASIPFDFKYDGNTYNSVQMSTNGWLELGTGTPGSLHGLSTASQLGGFFRFAQADTERPTKVLGPWWTDLSTNGAVGQITYATVGAPPNRVFVVQWKHILAYYDPGSTSTYLNFQVRLYETTNLIDLCYGPVSVGSFPSYATGATIVMKDYLGGDYRYYDFTKPGTGFAGDIFSNLSPITNWPGTDSCYRINTNIYTANVFAVSNRWNMVSIPLIIPGPANALKTIMFPSALTPAYRYAGHYIAEDTLRPGRGYWLKFSGTQTIAVVGQPFTADSFDVVPSWNLIGSISSPVAVSSITSSPGGMVSSHFFEYNAGYAFADTLRPGKAYWVKVNNFGKIVLSSSPSVALAQRLRMTLTSETPPPPPDESPVRSAALPSKFQLEQNYPNPFNPSTVISYELPSDSRVELKIYDMLGQEVATLVDGEQSAGYKSVRFIATDIPSGVYFYRVKAGEFTDIKKMLLLK